MHVTPYQPIVLPLLDAPLLHHCVAFYFHISMGVCANAWLSLSSHDDVVGGSSFVLISGVWGLRLALSSTHISVLIVSLPVCVTMAS